MESPTPKNQYKYSYFPILLFVSSVLIYLTSLHSYLLFHFLVELFTIVIAFGIFAIAWSSRRYVSNNFLLILGMSFFFVGALDLIHTITFRGMGILSGTDSNVPTQLWIAARYLESVSFLAAIFLKRKVQKPQGKQKSKKPLIIFFLFATIFSLILLSIFYWKIFPTAYVENVGLTPFKKISEYIITAIFFLSTLLIVRRRKLLDPEMVNLIIFSLILKMASELSFTEYVGVYDFANSLGHVFKFMSFLFLYKAVLEIGLMKPYQFLFLDLQKSQEEYRQNQLEMQYRIEDHLAEAYVQLGLANRKISLLLEIGEHVDNKSDRNQIIEYIMNAARSACHANVALLYRSDSNGYFSLVRYQGISEEKIKQFRQVNVKNAQFIKHLARERKRINTSCQSMDGGCFNFGNKLSYFVAIPFVPENKLKGFLFLGFEKRRSMDSHELQFLDVFTMHATTALTQMKIITA